MAHTYRFGIEEEMFLADARTRLAPKGSLKGFHQEANRRLNAVERELLQIQVEVSSAPTEQFSEARDELFEHRIGLAEIARAHELLVFAAGTHPTATWPEQKSTQKSRYREMLEDLQMVGRRSVVCGMHVHVEVPQPDARVDLMNRFLPYLPILLALSASSPFWEKRRTGLAGYRLRAYAELPRTGLPELFEGTEDYDRYVETMIKAGAVQDASFFWWHIRPSIRYPTLELRVADSCTRLADSLMIAALYRCLIRLLVRRPKLNAGETGASRGFITENLWRAQRMGTQADLIEEKDGTTIPFVESVERLLALVAEDAAALGCETEVAQARIVAAEGSSADFQIAAYEAALKQGRGERAALGRAVDWLAQETASPG